MNNKNQSSINVTPGKLSKCGECKKQFYFVSQHKHFSIDDTEIIEIGCNCPHCLKWLHLGYFNPDLIDRQAKIRNNRQRRAFKRDYEKWQIEAREALGIAEPEGA
jgi:hypothetical protein